jgi:integrase
MSVRKRTWKTAKDETKEAWVVDYVDQGGKRRLKTFKRKKEADAYHARANIEVREGVHTPDSESITAEHAAGLWLESCSGLERATVKAYEQHVRLHIVPLLGSVKLSRLNVPTIRAFEDRLRQHRSFAMAKKILGSLAAIVADAQERGLVARNVVRDLRSRRKKGKENRPRAVKKGNSKSGLISRAGRKSKPLSTIYKAAGAVFF